ncbi:MAG: terpene cyclase/mutase family protein, partial [Gammaproteobacteria bacterium]|nr:terpene cyclase/mutase family protein [Gammaproteobacteria bacterium]
MRLLTFKNIVYKIMSDLLRVKTKVHESKVHLDKAIDWLVLAQDSTDDGGVSEGYHLIHGWLPSYPETTGYIIETFFDYYHKHNSNVIYKQRAIKMADWLVEIQHDDGAIPDSYFKKKMVFDTGMVIFGFARAFCETQDEKYRNAAIKAADWLLEQQDENGSWVKYAANNIPHAYYSRVAWSLLKVHEITLDQKYSDACRRNIDWCLTQQDKDGWFNQASFNMRDHDKPFTHTIAYTLRGILESGLYFNDSHYISTVTKSLDNLKNVISDSGEIAGTYGSGWSPNNQYSCLTGNAQLAIIMSKYSQYTNKPQFAELAKKINQNLKS